VASSTAASETINALITTKGANQVLALLHKLDKLFSHWHQARSKMAGIRNTFSTFELKENKNLQPTGNGTGTRGRQPSNSPPESKELAQNAGIVIPKPNIRRFKDVYPSSGFPVPSAIADRWLNVDSALNAKRIGLLFCRCSQQSPFSRLTLKDLDYEMENLASQLYLSKLSCSKELARKTNVIKVANGSGTFSNEIRIPIVDDLLSGKLRPVE